MWIMWITYLPRSCSPIFTTSPAPIVINRSPCVQFSNKKFSISSKVGKYSHGVPSSTIFFLQISGRNAKIIRFTCSIDISQYDVICKGKSFGQIPEEELWYVYKYEAGIHTRSSYVDNFWLREGWLQSLSDDAHNHQ